MAFFLVTQWLPWQRQQVEEVDLDDQMSKSLRHRSLIDSAKRAIHS
jgi:hypothetical protein